MESQGWSGMGVELPNNCTRVVEVYCGENSLFPFLGYGMNPSVEMLFLVWLVLCVCLRLAACERMDA